MNDKICTKCGVNVSLPYHQYCKPCKRISQGRTPERVRNESPAPGICPKCGIRPKLEYHNWCQVCKNESTAKWFRENPRYTPTQIASARHYAFYLLKSGKITRGPCVFCGDPGVEFHHYDYEPRTLNFDDVCIKCHDDAHRFLKTMLTLAWCGAIPVMPAMSWQGPPTS